MTYCAKCGTKNEDDFSTGKNNQSETINLYKKYGNNGLRYTIIANMEILCSSNHTISDFRGRKAEVVLKVAMVLKKSSA